MKTVIAACAILATTAIAQRNWHYSNDIPICDKAHIAFDQRDLAYCIDVDRLIPARPGGTPK